MFLYYVPGLTGRINQIDGWKSRVERANKGNITCGPDGAAGTILADKSMPSCDFGYFPDRQTWRRDGELWVGMFTDRAIVPALLERNEMIAGHEVTLADGNLWQIPLVYASPNTAEWQIALPRTFDVTDDGKWCYGDVVKDHQRLFEAGTRYYNAWMANMIKRADLNEQQLPQDDVEFELMLTDELDIVEAAIATNYRVRMVEIAMMKLIDTRHVQHVLDAMIDVPQILDRMNKKKQSA